MISPARVAKAIAPASPRLASLAGPLQIRAAPEWRGRVVRSLVTSSGVEASGLAAALWQELWAKSRAADDGRRSVASGRAAVACLAVGVLLTGPRRRGYDHAAHDFASAFGFELDAESVVVDDLESAKLRIIDGSSAVEAESGARDALRGRSWRQLEIRGCEAKRRERPERDAPGTVRSNLGQDTIGEGQVGAMGEEPAHRRPASGRRTMTGEQQRVCVELNRVAETEPACADTCDNPPGWRTIFVLETLTSVDEQPRAAVRSLAPVPGIDGGGRSRACGGLGLRATGANDAQ